MDGSIPWSMGIYLGTSPFPDFWDPPVAIPSSSSPTATYFYSISWPSVPLPSPPLPDSTPALISSFSSLPLMSPLPPPFMLILIHTQCRTEASTLWVSLEKEKYISTSVLFFIFLISVDSSKDLWLKSPWVKSISSQILAGTKPLLDSVFWMFYSHVPDQLLETQHHV